MDTKLTLKLDEEVIKKAKEYAKLRKISLSKLMENYLQRLTSERKEKVEISPLVKSLSGIINLPSDFNHKDGYADHLLEKYK